MNYQYSKDHMVTYTECDRYAVMSLQRMSELAQDCLTEYFATMKTDNRTLRDLNNAAWVYTKLSFHINRFPVLSETLHCVCSTIERTTIKTITQIVFLDKNGQLLAGASVEACPIDLQTRRIRRIDSISYPSDLETETSCLPEPFTLLRADLDDAQIVQETIVQPMDIDFTNHTNNTMYIRYLLNTIRTDFWENNHITDFQIHFDHESHENDHLQIYQRLDSENTYDYIIRKDQTTVIRARLIYTN